MSAPAGPIRIMRNGVPHYVAPWVKDASPHLKRLIGTSNNIMTPYSAQFRKSALTRVAYTTDPQPQYFAAAE